MSSMLNDAASTNKRWGMVVDLNRCVGCQTCTIACKQTNDTPPGVQWRKVIDVETGAFPDVQRLFMVTGCQHCDEPPCVPVCPTGATTKRADGIVAIDYDQCIGCAYCVVSCPYQARTLIHNDAGYYGEKTKQENATAHPERLGVAQKCTFCQPKVDEGLAKGLKPGIDLEATPACAASCIAQAINFGDFNDKESNVSVLARDHSTMRLNEYVGTDPQIKYLYTTPAVKGRDLTKEPFTQAEESLRDPANPVVGSLQKFWDWRAAMNWIFGGIGSGLLAFSMILIVADVIPMTMAKNLILCSLTSISIGLFFVFLKIGRKLRFWRAVLRPQTSWMTRELYVVAVLFPVTLYSAVNPHRFSLMLSGLLGLSFLYCQAMILFKARGIPAWRSREIPWMIFCSGLLEGLGFLQIILGLQGYPLNQSLTMLSAVILICVSLILWVRYSMKKDEPFPPLAMSVIRVTSPFLFTLGAMMIGALIYGLFTMDSVFGISILFGSLAIIYGMLWKYRVIVKAGYFNGLSYNFASKRFWRLRINIIDWRPVEG